MTHPQQAAGSDDWRIGRRGGKCAGCSADFVPGAEAVSALYRAGETWERRDFCSRCFQEAPKRGEPFSWWAAVVPQPEAKKAVFDLGVAKEFFLRLLREDAPEQRSLRYLLALMLMRKKVVLLDGQTTDSRGEVMAVRVPPDDTTHEIVAVEIDEAESERLRDELGRLFQLT